MISIRKAQEEDRNGIVAVLRTVLPDAQPRNEPNRVLDEKWRVDQLVFVAEEEDRKIVGTVLAGYDGHRGWLYSLAVLPGWRGQQIGSRLVEAALDSLTGIGCSKVNLQIRGENRDVVPFYSALGFAVEDRISMGLVLAGE